MSTTIEEPQTEDLVAQPEASVMFMCRRQSLRLTITPRYSTRDPVSGQQTGTTKGSYVAFREGVFRCPLEGEVTLVDSLDGGEAKMLAADVISWLEGHRLFGNREEGFWRVDATAPAPSQGELQAMMDAAVELDDVKLREIIRQEEAGWAREDVLATARDVVERIEAVKEQARIDAAEAAGKPADPPADPKE